MTEQREPRVSIGVPVYNGEKYLARALDSLLAQDFADFEIIICDNASTDATGDIAEAYAQRDPRVHYHRNRENLGLAGNFNRTFELARGEYFKWATHDDWHAPQALSVAVKALDANPAAVVCASGVSLVDEHGDEFDQWLPSVDLETPPPHQRLHRLLWSMGETHPMYGLLRSSALRQTHVMQSYVGSDRTLLAELILLGPFVQVPEILHFYTVARPPDYRPSVTYDPANVTKLPLRTWRLLEEHLRIVARSDLPLHHKLFLAGSVLGRFAGRDFRRLMAELYHSARIVGARTRRRLTNLPPK